MVEETINKVYLKREKIYDNSFDIFFHWLFQNIYGLFLFIFTKYKSENRLGSAGNRYDEKMVNIFGKNMTVYIDLEKRNFVFSKKGKNILLSFENIKEIVLVRYYELGFYNRLAIDIYDTNIMLMSVMKQEVMMIY
jgi:hypothetical protein